MAQVKAGVVGSAELSANAQQANGSGMSTSDPAFWSTGIFVAAGLFLLFLFFAGRR